MRTPLPSCSPWEPRPTGMLIPQLKFNLPAQGGSKPNPDPNQALDAKGKQAASIIQQLPWYSLLRGLAVFGVKIGQSRIVTAP